MPTSESAPEAIAKQLIELCQSSPPVHSFNRQLLHIIIDSVDAMAATLWLVRENELILSEEIEQTVGAVRSLRLTDEAQQGALRAAFERGELGVLKDGVQGFDPLNPTGVEQRSVVFIPVAGLRGNIGVLRLVFEPLPRQAVSRLIQLGDVISGYYSLYTAQRVLTVQQEERQDIDRLSKAILQLQHYTFSSQLPEVIVNSAIEVAPLDRVILLAASKGGDLHLSAVSSVAQPDKKGTWARLACELGEVVLDRGKPVQFFPGKTPPEDIEDEELRKQVSSYVLMTDVKSLLLYPLASGEQKAGVLICEKFADPTLTPFERVLLTVFATHTASALGNCRLFQSIPLSGMFAKRLDKEEQQVARRPFRARVIVKWAAILVAVAVVLWFLFLYQVDDRIKAQCFVEPYVTRVVTAKVAGQIEDVLFRKGSVVEKGQGLIKFRTNEIELSLRKAAEDANNIRAELTKLRGEAETEKDPQRRGQLLAEIHMREHSLVAKEQEVKILQYRLENCYYRSPITGIVLEPEEPAKLVSVTVDEGEPLCRIGAVEEQVRIRVAVPGDRVTEVWPQEEVEVLLRPYLEKAVLRGTVESVAERSVTYKNANVFMADVVVNNIVPSKGSGKIVKFQLKPGMTGKARIIKPAKSTYASIYGRLIYRTIKYWMY